MEAYFHAQNMPIIRLNLISSIVTPQNSRWNIYVFNWKSKTKLWSKGTNDYITSAAKRMHRIFSIMDNQDITKFRVRLGKLTVIRNMNSQEVLNSDCFNHIIIFNIFFPSKCFIYRTKYQNILNFCYILTLCNLK